VARKESRELTAAIAASARAGTNALQFMPYDLEDIDAMPRFVASLRKGFGPIHGLVNNAALGDDGALSLMHTSKIERLVRMNPLSPMVLTKYVVRAMMADGGGRIVNVASIVGFTGYSGLSV
jgi:3-oxoacyl-[acyl-carrier protein] reductase